MQKVKNSEEGMAEEHSWAGKAHHLPHPLPKIRSVTVNWAVGTCRFFLAERAKGQAGHGVLPQSPAILTEATSPMEGPAVHPDHRRNRLRLPPLLPTQFPHSETFASALPSVFVEAQTLPPRITRFAPCHFSFPSCLYRLPFALVPTLVLALTTSAQMVKLLDRQGP